MAFETTLAQMKYIALGILYIAIAAVLIYIVSYIIIRHKRNAELEDMQRRIIREGAINKKKFKLRYLFSSNGYANPVNEGKIIGYVMAKEKERNVGIFAVRKSPLSQAIFYKVDAKDHSDLFRDVTLKEWNFCLDEQNIFLVPNLHDVRKRVAYDERLHGVDTIGNLAPLVHKAILSNFVHRIRLRERKLIKLPEEELRG